MRLQQINFLKSLAKTVLFVCDLLVVYIKKWLQFELKNMLLSVNFQ